MADRLFARYFDGRSSLGRDVLVYFEEGQLWFELIDEEGSARRLTWQKEQVAHEKLGNGSLRKISYAAEPNVFLEFETTETAVIDGWISSQRVKSRNYNLFISNSLLIAIFIGVLSIIPLFYFVLLPLAADYAAERLPKEYEIDIGREMSATVLKGMKEDTKRSALCDSFLAVIHPELNYPVQIHVVEEETVNAFALPGGQIFVHSAMIDACRSKEEFAALLGHEIGHVELRHSAKAVMRSLANSALLTILVGDVGSVAGIAAARANDLKNLEFSRKLESQADEFSLRFMTRARLDPQGLVRLFQTLKEEEEKRDLDIPEFLSSHPLSKAREKRAKEQLESMDFSIRENQRLEQYFKQLKRSSGSDHLSGQ